MTRKNFDEQEVLALIRNEETLETAFRMILEEFKKPLYWHIKRMVNDHNDTDDILQNAFIKAWKNLGNFRGESKLKTWLWRIGINETLTFIQQKKKRLYVDVDLIGNHSAFSHSDHSPISGEEIQSKLQNAIDSLPVKQKQVFTMKYFEDLTYEEMSVLLGGTSGSLKASFHHAAKKIEAFLINSLNHPVIQSSNKNNDKQG